jgi:hypothetical protein
MAGSLRLAQGEERDVLLGIRPCAAPSKDGTMWEAFTLFRMKSRMSDCRSARRDAAARGWRDMVRAHTMRRNAGGSCSCTSGFHSSHLRAAFAMSGGGVLRR